MYPAVSFPIAVPPYGGVLLGLGDQQSAQQAVQYGGAAAGSAAAIASIPAVGLIPASAVPFIGPALAAAVIGISLLIKNSGCGQTCIETSQWADQAEKGLEQVIQNYFAQSPRYRSTQQTALGAIDAIVNRLVQMCSDPSTGNAGKRCMSDRMAGACTWKQTATSPLLQYPGEPQPGQCWNWINGYRDPIANDPDVQPDTVASSVTSAASDVTGSVANVLQSAGVNPSLAGPLLIAALLAIGAVVVLS